MIKIIIDETRAIEVTPETLERICGAAEFNLVKIKRAEGKKFPRRDQVALTATYDIQYALMASRQG